MFPILKVLTKFEDLQKTAFKFLYDTLHKK